MLFLWIEIDPAVAKFRKNMYPDRDSWPRNQDRMAKWLLEISLFGSWSYLGVQVLKIGVLVFSSRVFENLKKNIENFHRFRNFRCFWVFVLRYRTDSKDGNDGKFKPNFSAKYMPRMLFLWARIDSKGGQFPKSWIWTHISLAGIKKGHDV